MPVPFNIVVQINMATLQIKPSRLDFRKLFDGQGAKRAITLENLSDLPQELSIYPLPKENSISTDLVPLSFSLNKNLQLISLTEHKKQQELVIDKMKEYQNVKLIQVQFQQKKLEYHILAKFLNVLQNVQDSIPNQKSEKRVFIWVYCYNRQAYVNIYYPYNLIPQINEINKKIEFAFDQLKLKDEEKVYTYLNNKILIEFQKLKEEDNYRKIVIGSCKLLDSKIGKPVNYKVILQKDENILCVTIKKGAIQPRNEVIITFTFKPPQPNQFIGSIETLKKIGQWKETKIELKISGGFLKARVQDNISYELILKAFINQI